MSDHTFLLIATGLMALTNVAMLALTVRISRRLAPPHGAGAALWPAQRCFPLTS
jgi:hypothetical protein